MSRSHLLTTISGLFVAAVFFLTGSVADAQQATPATPVTTEQPPVTTDFLLLIDARQTMAMNTNTSGNPYGRLEIAVAAANTAVQAVPVGTNLGIIILQSDVRTLRPLSPLQAADRSSIQAALSKLAPIGNAPMRDAILYLPKVLPHSNSMAQTFLVVATDGSDSTFDQTLQATSALKPWAKSLRSVMLATYVAESSRTNLQKIAQAIHPDDNAHHVLHHGELPTGLLPLQRVCDAIEDNRQQRLVNAASDLHNSQQLVGRLQNQLAALQQIEANRDQLRNQLDAMTQAEATQRSEASRLNNEVAKLTAWNAQADKEISHLKAARQDDQLAAVTRQAELDTTRSALATTQANLASVTHDRDSLHRTIVADVDAKRGLESELKAAQVKNDLLTNQLKDSRQAEAGTSTSTQELKQTLSKIETQLATSIKTNNDQITKLNGLVEEITKFMKSPLEYFSEHWGALLTLLGFGGSGGGAGIYLIAKLLGADPGTIKKSVEAQKEDVNKKETERMARVEKLQERVDELRQTVAVNPELASQLHQINASIADMQRGSTAATSETQAASVTLQKRFDELEDLITNATDRLAEKFSNTPAASAVKASPAVKSDLALIQGLGKATERKLVERSIASIQALASVKPEVLSELTPDFDKIFEWQKEASRLLDIAEKQKVGLRDAADILKKGGATED